MQTNFVLVERDDLRRHRDVRKLIDWLLVQRI